MTEPANDEVVPLQDRTAIERLLKALYSPGDRFFLTHYEEKVSRNDKGKKAFHQSDFVYRDESLQATVDLVVAYNRCFGVATSVGCFGPPEGGRSEANTKTFRAMGVDIDAKNFAGLDGAGSVQQAIDRAVARLSARGIQPHAVVNSGYGVHVYLLLEPVDVSGEAARASFKDLWWRLCQVLGGADDRFDLASVLRLPGTFNRKYRGRVPVAFVEAHTALDRRRYSLEEVQRALADIPVRQEVRGKPALKEPVPVELEKLAEAVQVALKLDKKLADLFEEAQAHADDRSKNDYHLACDLIRAGCSVEEVASAVYQSHKARNQDGRREEYSLSTSRAASSEVLSFKSAGNLGAFGVFPSGNEAFYTVVEREPALVARYAADGQVPSVGIVRARAGDGKTTDVIEALSTAASLRGRTAVCSEFVPELLRHEYYINLSFPTGRFMGLDRDGRPTGPPPWGTEVRLPETVEDLATTGEFVVEGRDATTAKLKTTDLVERSVNPAAFFINSVHPLAADERQNPDHDWYHLFEDRQPMAVAKFRGREDLCFQLLGKATLDSGKACGTCAFTSCRANHGAGGAKTYWKDAPVPLLTHRALGVQAVFAPHLNKFEAAVVDELPSFVFRTPELVLVASHYGAEKRWSVEPLDTVLGLLGAARASLSDAEKGAANAVERLLRDAARKLKKHAGVVAKRVAQEKRKPNERMATTCEPVLSSDQFTKLLSLLGKREDPPDDTSTNAYEDEDEAPRTKWSPDHALLVLRDFCGSAPMEVYFEHTFDRTGVGRLRITRPVNGWSELLNHVDGTSRPTVILDATAGLDPRYLLAGGAPEEGLPEHAFPQTTLVLTAEGRRSKVTPRPYPS